MAASEKPPRAPVLFPIVAGAPLAACRSCEAPAYWIVTAKEKRILVEVGAPGTAHPTARDPGVGTAHFATCPHADDWRKAR